MDRRGASAHSTLMRGGRRALPPAKQCVRDAATAGTYQRRHRYESAFQMNQTNQTMFQMQCPPPSRRAAIQICVLQRRPPW
eukprot:2436357-Pyramimonas_sp.AAC.1